MRYWGSKFHLFASGLLLLTAAGAVPAATQSPTEIGVNLGTVQIPNFTLPMRIEAISPLAAGPVFAYKDIVAKVRLRTRAPQTLALQRLKAQAFFMNDLRQAQGSAALELPVGYDPRQETLGLPATVYIPHDVYKNHIGPDGTLRYFIEVSDGRRRAAFGTREKPLVLRFVDQAQYTVSSSNPEAVVADTHLDGKTKIHFRSLSRVETLQIRQENPAALPPGPGGQKPVVAFSFHVEGRDERDPFSLADLTLSYRSNPDGTVPLEGSNAAWDRLGLYRFDGLQWVAAGPASVDSTLHTLTFPSPYVGQFALFAAGAVTGAAARPADRILTPNGDGLRDTTVFSGVTDTDDVRIFDIRGRRVRSLQGPTPIWDGRDDDGQIVESGIYIYQYTSNGERVSGVLSVAK